MNDLHSEWWGGMGVGMTLFWLLVIAVILILIKRGTSGSSSQSGNVSGSPMKVLQKRYASGEINKEEFEKMKEELEI